MAAEKRSLILISIVLALMGWVFAYFSPLYHEWRRRPRIVAEYNEIDFVHFTATRFKIANRGRGEEKEVRFILPRFIFPGGGTPCTTTVRDYSPYHIRYALENLPNKRVLRVFNLSPGESLSFTVYKGCFESVEAYYALKPTVSYQTLLDGVQVKSSRGDVPLVEKKEKPMTKPQRRRPS